MTDKEMLELLLEGQKEIKARLDNVEQKVTDTRLHLENVTDRNIRLIAEGHLNLNRKLDETLKTSHTDTLYHIKVNELSEKVDLLTKEIEELKNRIA